MLSDGKRQQAKQMRQLSPMKKVNIGGESRTGQDGPENRISILRPLPNTGIGSQASNSSKFRESAKQIALGQLHEESNIRSKPYLNSTNVGKINVSLRHHGRIGGLGPCLEERQMNVIDKIWGNFKTE